VRSALDPALAAAAFCHFAAVAGGIGIELGSENGERLASDAPSMPKFQVRT
jgi:hypothetical protein